MNSIRIGLEVTSEIPKSEKLVGANGKEHSRNRVSDLEDEVAENRYREVEEIRRTLVNLLRSTGRRGYSGRLGSRRKPRSVAMGVNREARTYGAGTPTTILEIRISHRDGKEDSAMVLGCVVLLEKKGSPVSTWWSR